MLLQHPRSVYHVAISGDGAVGVTVCADGCTRVWDLRSGKEVHVLPDYEHLVRALALSTDGATLVQGLSNGDVCVRDARTGFLLGNTLHGHTAAICDVALSLDGSTLVTASDDATARVWDLRSGETVRVLSGHARTVTAVAITARGDRAITSSHDCTDRVWDLRTGACLSSFPRPICAFAKVSVTEDGAMAMTWRFNESPRFWRPNSDETVKLGSR